MESFTFTDHSMKVRVLIYAVVTAVIYAVAILASAELVAWPLAQLGPSTIIPAIFTVLYGPLAGGISAALGALIGGWLIYGTPIIPLASGVPANLLGFYLLGHSFKNLGGDWISRYAISCAVGLGTGFVVMAAGLYTLASSFPQLTAIAKWSWPPFLALGIFYGMLSEAPLTILLGVPLIDAVERIRRRKRTGAEGYRAGDRA